MIVLSVVIPTFNRKDTLKPVLEALDNQIFPHEQFEIIVIDSNSTDGTSEMISHLDLKPSLTYIRQENAGRAGARNSGIKQAKGDIILFTDADIVASPSLLEEHMKIHRIKHGEAVVGLEVQVSSLEEYKYLAEHPEKRKELHPRHRKEISWLYFMTGNASVSRDELIKAGMFDVMFQGYGWEDIELGYRLAKNGVKINYSRSAVNYHVHPVPLDKRFEIMTMAGRSAVKFYKKHGDWKIRYLLGMNPIVMKLHSLIKPDGWFMRFCRNNSKKSKFFTDILLQYNYINGVKEEWNKK